MTPENLAKLDQYLREDEFLRIEPPEGFVLCSVEVNQIDDYSLPCFEFWWGGRQGDEIRGPSWSVTVSLAIGMNALLAIL